MKIKTVNNGGCSSLCLLSCVSEWAQMCVCARVCAQMCVCVCVNPTECMVKLKGGMFLFLRQYEWMYVGVHAACTFMLRLSLSVSGQRHFFCSRARNVNTQVCAQVCVSVCVCESRTVQTPCV